MDSAWKSEKTPGITHRLLQCVTMTLFVLPSHNPRQFPLIQDCSMPLNSCAFNMFAKPVLPCFWQCGKQVFLQDRGIAEVGRDLWRLSSPSLLLTQRSARAGCSGLCLIRFWISPRMESAHFHCSKGMHFGKWKLLDTNYCWATAQAHIELHSWLDPVQKA